MLLTLIPSKVEVTSIAIFFTVLSLNPLTRQKSIISSSNILETDQESQTIKKELFLELILLSILISFLIPSDE